MELFLHSPGLGLMIEWDLSQIVHIKLEYHLRIFVKLIFSSIVYSTRIQAIYENHTYILITVEMKQEDKKKKGLEQE